MDESSPWLLLVRLAAGVAIVILIYCVLFGRRAEFVIHVRRGHVRCKGKVPLALQQRLTHFILENLGIKDSVRILGAHRGKRLQVWFRGRISPGEQQRIRNFLLLSP
jgi:hypothetical protein